MHKLRVPRMRNERSVSLTDCGLTARPATKGTTMTDYTNILADITQADLTATGGSSGHTPYDLAYLEITAGDAVSLQIRTVYSHSDGIPMSVWHNIDRRYDLIGNADLDTLRTDLADGGDLAVLIDRVKDGHSTHWDGSNHVGRFTAADAAEASDDLRNLLADYPTSNCVWYGTNEWLWGSHSRAASVLDELGLTVDATEAQVAEAVASLEDDARHERVVLIGDSLADVIASLIRQARQDAANAAALASDD